MVKKKAIVTGGTKNMVPAMGVLALNISKICHDIADELVIYHDGISIVDQKKISSIFPTRFILYNNPFITLNNFDKVVTNYFSSMVFCKYECFNLLHEYSQVIWTDYDVVILQDFTVELFSKNKSLIVIPDTELGTLSEMFQKEIYKIQLPGVDLSKTGICLPLFIVRDTFPDFIDFYEECIQLTKELSPYLYLPEQCIISILLQRNKIVYDTLPYIPYAAHPIKHQVTSDIFIIHASGQPKFWNGLNNEQWNLYYQQWINDYHGKKFKRKKIKISTFIVEYFNKNVRRIRRLKNKFKQIKVIE